MKKKKKHVFDTDEAVREIKKNEIEQRGFIARLFNMLSSPSKKKKVNILFKQNKDGSLEKID